MHCYAGRSRNIDTDFLGIIHPDAIFDDFGFKTRLPEFGCDVVSGRFIFRGTGDVRCLSKRTQMLLCELRVRNRQESILGRNLLR